MRVRSMVAGVAAAFLLGAAVDLHAFDLDGSWAGKYRCENYDGSRFKVGQDPSTLVITQVGNTVAMRLDGTFFYVGQAFEDDKNADRGQIALAHCAGGPTPFREVIRFKVVTKPSRGFGSLKGESFHEGDWPATGKCKYTFKWTNTVDPGLPLVCPP